MLTNNWLSAGALIETEPNASDEERSESPRQSAEQNEQPTWTFRGLQSGASGLGEGRGGQRRGTRHWSKAGGGGWALG